MIPPRGGRVGAGINRVRRVGSLIARTVVETLSLNGAILKLTASPELRIAQETELTLGDLPAKHSVTVPILVTALQPGNGSLQVHVKASDGLSGQATATCRLTAPGLALRIEGPSEWFVGRDHTVTLPANSRDSRP